MIQVDGQDAPVETSAETERPAADASSAEKTLSPEEEARKRRAERFGLEFKPKTAAPAAAPASSSKPPASNSAPAPAPAKKEKPSAIDKSASLGISEEVLAARAAKFGLPEKKASAAPASAAETKPASKTAPSSAAKPAPAEITPYAIRLSMECLADA